MWKWWFRRREKGERPSPQEEGLKGAPLKARVKTYSAETGFVYQYVYRGYRRVSSDLGVEHVFEANRDRKLQLKLTVHLLDVETEQCSSAIGRELIAAERYALVKMSLFAALDEVVDSAQLERPLIPSAAEMEGHLRRLGRI